MCYSIISIGLNGYSNQSPSICTHRQGKGTSFFASLQLLHTKNNSWGGTKDESHSSGIFWIGIFWIGHFLDGAECRLDGKRAAHIVLHYVKTITKTLGCLLGLN